MRLIRQHQIKLLLSSNLQSKVILWKFKLRNSASNTRFYIKLLFQVPFALSWSRWHTLSPHSFIPEWLHPKLSMGIMIVYSLCIFMVSWTRHVRHVCSNGFYLTHKLISNSSVILLKIIRKIS